MPAATTSARLSTDSRLAGWLMVAILAHALLLLVPSRRDLHSDEDLPSLAISLLRPMAPSPTTHQPPPQERPADPLPAPLRSTPAEQQPSASTAAPERSAEHAMEPPLQQPAPSTAYLLDLAGRRDWNLPETSPAPALGEPVPRPMPPNWRTVMKPEATRFDGMAVPTEVEIVDRWLAADGSHNVVITTPDGDTYCGRAAAWDPLNPLVEPVMSYRSCGGGGKRTFDMPNPYNRSAAAGERTDR